MSSLVPRRELSLDELLADYASIARRRSWTAASATALRMRSRDMRDILAWGARPGTRARDFFDGPLPELCDVDFLALAELARTAILQSFVPNDRIRGSEPH